MHHNQNRPATVEGRHVYKDHTMFSLFKKDPVAKLNKAYLAKLEKAMQAQRNGDIKAYSMITAEAEQIAAEIQQLKDAQHSGG